MRAVAEVSSFDLLAASLRADLGDMKAFVEALAVKLSASFPDRVKVERKGGRFGGEKRVRRVVVELGDREFELEHEEGRVTCRRRSVVRGIALKNEELPLEEWIDDLSRQLAEEAGQTERGRASLQRLIES
jgi:hypothetical protein